MIKSTKFAALALLLSIMAVGCQKEVVHNIDSTSAIPERDVLFQIHYTVDGVECGVDLYSEAEKHDFIKEMLSLAKQGHTVVMYYGEVPSQEILSKEILHYSTINVEEAIAWTEARVAEGYKVAYDYDPKTKTYNCVAFR